MQKLSIALKLLILSFLLFIPKNIDAALSAGTIWELRSAGALASAGCYDNTVAVAGTDYSQQGSAQFSGTDLSVDAVTNTQVASSSHNFVASDEGNCIHITAGAGFTQGWYMITDSGSNEAFLDRSPGAVGITGGTWAEGGANFVDDATLEAASAGNVFHVKNDGTYTLAAINVAAGSAGTLANSISINGYNSSRGDMPVEANRPTLAAAGNTLIITAIHWNIKDINITTTAANGLSFAAGSNTAKNVKSFNSSGTAGRNAFNLVNTNLILNCEAISTNGNGLSFSNSFSVITNNYIHDSSIGINTTAGIASLRISNNILDTNTTGISLFTGAGKIQLEGNTFYNSTTCISGDADGLIVENNIFNTCTTGINWTALKKNNFDDYNNYSNNSTDVANWTKGSHDTTGVPGFVDAPNGNFAINTTLKATGFPGAFPGALSTGYLDPGAVQRQETATCVGVIGN